jgi:metal-responsive CopG/Arc/MetJ family transcriptional regulator
MAPKARIPLHVRLTADLNDKLDTLVAACGRNRSEILRALIYRAQVDDLPRAWTELSEDDRQCLAAVE